jgi:hypothetical protein
MSDITIVFLTLNRTPSYWNGFHRECLLDAADGAPILTISREPTNFGTNIIESDPPGYINIYRQMLKAAKMIDTPYMAIAEDDTLYSKEHFYCFRPAPDEAAYNRARWSLFQWDKGRCYSLRNRVSNCSFIGHKNLVIDALTERFDKYGDNWPARWTGEIGRINVERGLRVKRRKLVEFFSEVPIIQVSHEHGTEERQRRARKRHAQIKAYDIPFWGKSTSLIKEFK